MAQTNAAEDADAESTDEERETYAWVSQQPNSRIVGTPVDLIYAGELGSDVAQNDDSYILLLKDAEVVNGSLFVNEEKPDDGTTADSTGEDEPRSTDYRVISEDSGVGTFVKGSLTTGENGANVYDEADEFAEDVVAVFYNGVTGSRVGRTMDFNGRQYARWTETPYLVKGLYQAHPDWRGADSQTRSDLAQNGKAPRVARVPIPRFHVDGSSYDSDMEGDEIVIDMTLLRPDQSNSGYEVHIFDAAAMEAEFGDSTTPVDEMDRGQWGLDVDSELDYISHDDPESVLEDAEVGFSMYTGEGWPDEPADWELEYDLQTSFGIQAAINGDDDSGGGQTDEAAFEEDLHNFASEVATALPDGQSPEDVFDGGLSGLVESRADQFRGREPTADDIANIRSEVYSEVNWLDPSSLEE